MGDIVAQAAVPIAPSAHVQQLTATLARLGSDLLQSCLEDLPAALAAARPQAEEGVTLGRSGWRSGGLFSVYRQSCLGYLELASAKRVL